MLDFRDEDGRAAFLALASRVDIIVQNFRPRVIDRMGIGYDDMKAVNPDVMYLSIPSPGSVSTIPSPKDKGRRGSYLRTAMSRARVTYETCCVRQAHLTRHHHRRRHHSDDMRSRTPPRYSLALAPD